MTNDQHHDIDHQLRRVADHLTRRGVEYRERSVVVPGGAPAQRRGFLRGGSRVAAASVLLVSACVAAVAVLGTGEPVRRLQPMSSGDTQATTDGAATDSSNTRGPATTMDGLESETESESESESAVDGVPRTGSEAPQDSSGDPVTDPTVTVPPVIVEGPVISAVEVPRLVAAGSSVTFRWRVVDVDTVASTGITVGWASGIYTACGFGQSARLASGTSRDGIWEYSCAIPADAVSTEYSVEVHAQDGLGNWSRAGGYGFSITGGSSDATPPAPSDVRVVGGFGVVGEVLTITWTLTDPSGIDSAVMWVAGPTGGFTDLETGRRYAMYETMVVTSQCSPSGDTCSFTQTVQLDPAAPAGVYSLWLSATDNLGNKVLEEVFAFTVAG
jgi:hypothetical protein